MEAIQKEDCEERRFWYASDGCFHTTACVEGGSRSTSLAGMDTRVRSWKVAILAARSSDDLAALLKLVVAFI